MIDGLKPYPKYKNSSLPWLEELPAHWEMIPNRALMQEQRKVVGESADDYTLLSLTLTGIIPRNVEKPKGKFPARFNAYKVVRSGDLVFCLFDIDETPRAVGLSQLEGMITGAYDIFTPNACVDARYIHYYYLHIDDGKLLKPLYTGLRKTIQRGAFASLKSPLPPTEEQGAIVRFLDHSNGRIEQAIRGKKKLIALLNEQKQAIIQRAVTRGIDPTVPLTSSGVPWLGDIPKHWEARRIKQISSILRGKFSHRPRNDSSLYNGSYPFIQTGAVARASKFITHYKQTLNDKGLAVSKLFPSGTLCMTIAANIGDVAILDFEACFPDSIVGMVPHEGIERDYLFLVLRSMKQEFLLEAPINTQGNLSVNRIGAMRVPYPPIKEQTEIVLHVEKETKPFEVTIERAHREIALLREYRTRLTADVVTGKLDVREAARNLPQVAVEPEITLDTGELAEVESEDVEA